MNRARHIFAYFLFLMLLAKSGESRINDSNLETIEVPQTTDSPQLQTKDEKLETISLLQLNSHVSLWRKLASNKLDRNEVQDSISHSFHSNNSHRRQFRHNNRMWQTVANLENVVAPTTQGPLIRQKLHLSNSVSQSSHSIIYMGLGLLKNVSNNIVQGRHFIFSEKVVNVKPKNILTNSSKIVSPPPDPVSLHESVGKPVKTVMDFLEIGQFSRKPAQQSGSQYQFQSAPSEKIKKGESSPFFNNPYLPIQNSAELPEAKMFSTTSNHNKSYLEKSQFIKPFNGADPQVENEIRRFSPKPSIQNFNPKLMPTKPKLLPLYEAHLQRKFAHPTAEKNSTIQSSTSSLSPLRKETGEDISPEIGGSSTLSPISSYSTHVFIGESGLSPNHSLNTQHFFKLGIIPLSIQNYWKTSSRVDAIESREWQNDGELQNLGSTAQQDPFKVDRPKKKVFLNSPTHLSNFVTVENFSVSYAKSGSDIDNNSSQNNCTRLSLECVNVNDSESDNNTNPENNRYQLEQGFKQSHPVELWISLGFYDDAYLANINSHWLQFPPADRHVHKILGICYTIICLLGCGGNLLVIIMCIRCPSLRNPPIYLVVNLAVSDFFMLAKTPIFIYNSYYEGPALGAIGCQIYGFLGGLTGTCSIMTLSAISLDRYYVIAYPFNPLKRTSSSRAFCMVVFVWIYSLLFSSMPLFGWNAYVSEGYLTSCSFEYLSSKLSDKIFVFIFFLAAYILPLILIVYSYVNIFLIVRQAEVLQFSGGSSGESFKCKHDKKKQKTEVKIALLSFIIILVWSLAWTPYAIVALLGIFGYHSALTPLVSSIPALFCKTASCIDPFIYAINHPKFQRELRNKFPCCPSRLRLANRRRELSEDNPEDLTMMERTASSKKSSIKSFNRSSSVKSQSAKNFQKGSSMKKGSVKLGKSEPFQQTVYQTISNIPEPSTSTNQYCRGVPSNYELNEVVSTNGDAKIKQNPKIQEKVLVSTHIQVVSTSFKREKVGESSCGKKDENDEHAKCAIFPDNNEEEGILTSGEGSENQLAMSTFNFVELSTNNSEGSEIRSIFPEVSSQSQIGEKPKIPEQKPSLPLIKIAVMNQQKDRRKSESDGENTSTSERRVKLETLIM